MTVRNTVFRLSLDDGIKNRLVELKQQALALGNKAVGLKVSGLDQIGHASKAAQLAGLRAKEAGDQANAALRKAADGAHHARKAIDSIEDVFSRGIPNALESLDKHLVSTLAHLTGVSKGVAAAGAAAAIAVGTAVAAGLGISITKAADLEKALIRVSKLTGIEDKKALGSDIQKMMKATGKGLDEVSTGYEMAGSAGIGGKLIAKGDLEGARKEIGDFVAITMQAADAFEMPAEQASAGLSAMNTMLKPLGVSTSDFMSKVGSAIDAAGNATIAKEKDILDAMQKAAGAVTFAIPTEKLTKDMIALSTAIISTGESGESAGESIKDFMRNLAKDEGGKVSASLGMDKGTFQKALKADPMAIVDKVIAKYTKMSDSSKGKYSSIFGDTGAKVLTLSRSENFRTAQADAKAVVGTAYDKGTQLKESFEKSMNGFWKQLDRLFQILIVVAQCIGSVFLPSIELVLGVILGIIDPLSSLVAGFTNLLTAIPGGDMLLLVAGFGLAASAIGVLYAVLVPLITGMGIYGTVLTSLGIAHATIAGQLAFLTSGTVLQTIANTGLTLGTTLATIATWGLNAAMAVLNALNPFTYLVIGAVALVAVVGYVLNKTGALGKAFEHLAGLKDRLVAKWANIDIVKGLKTVAVDLFKGVMKFAFNLRATPFGQGVTKALQTLMAVLLFPLKTLCDLFGLTMPTWETIKNILSYVYSIFVKFVQGIKDALGFTRKEKKDEMDKQAADAGLQWKEKDDINNKPEGWYDTAGNPASAPATLAKAKADYDAAPKGLVEQFTDSLKGYFDSIFKWLEKTFKPLADVLVAIADYLGVAFAANPAQTGAAGTPGAPPTSPPPTRATFNVGLQPYTFDPEPGSSATDPRGLVGYSDLSQGGQYFSVPVGSQSPAVRAAASKAAHDAGIPGYAVGAEFKRDGRFEGDVHATEEIMPKAITQRGPGPIAQVLADLYGNRQMAPEGNMAAPIIHIEIKVAQMSGDTDIEKLANQVLTKSRDALLSLHGRHSGYLQGGSAYR